MPHETVTELSQLIDRVKSYNVEADLDLVRRAYDFSAKAHEGQMRRSGEPYFRHPLAVAGLLTHLKTDVTAIVAGLLHDTLEDTLATPLELEQRFGKDVVHLVDGVTNPTNVATPPVSNSANQIRKVNLFVSARSVDRDPQTRQFFRNSMATDVGLRSLSFVDRYR